MLMSSIGKTLDTVKYLVLCSLLLAGCKSVEVPSAPVATAPVPVVKQPRSIKIGLALGGGAAR
ncbi:MAG TPA: hypothetical protein VK751_19485, partial [Undibacterium sp.]|nr:hypothetical protein [Undibacterium sp.]